MIQYTWYQVHNSNNNMVIFWNMTNIHVVPDRQQYTWYWITTSTPVLLDRQQYDRHTLSSSRKRRYDTWCKRRYDTWYKHVIVNLFKRIFDNFQTTTQHPRSLREFRTGRFSETAMLRVGTPTENRWISRAENDHSSRRAHPHRTSCFFLS